MLTSGQPHPAPPPAQPPSSASPRRRSRRLPAMGVEVSGTPTSLAGIASLLLHLHSKPTSQQRFHEVPEHA